MTTAHRPTWAAAQAAASDVGNWSTGGTKRICRDKLCDDPRRENAAVCTHTCVCSLIHSGRSLVLSFRYMFDVSVEFTR